MSLFRLQGGVHYSHLVTAPQIPGTHCILCVFTLLSANPEQALSLSLSLMTLTFLKSQLFFCFLGPLPQHMEVPRPGV